MPRSTKFKEGDKVLVSTFGNVKSPILGVINKVFTGDRMYPYEVSVKHGCFLYEEKEVFAVSKIYSSVKELL